MIGFAWTSARTISEAAVAATATVAGAMTASPEAMGRDDLSVVKAGGIDLVDLMKENLLAPTRVVSLTGIPGLDRISEAAAGSLRIGAMVTLASLADHPQVRRRYAALADAARGAASPQIRNVATLGGNLLQRPRCWYLRAQQYRCLRKGGGHCYAIAGENQYHAIFDNGVCAIVHPSTAATALVALGATVELASGDGAARRVLLEDFFVAPDRDLQRENDLQPQEILTAIELPAPPTKARMAYRQQGERDSFDWPLADVAVVLELAPGGQCQHATVILGAAAPVPHRAKAAEAALAGRHIDESTAREAGRAAMDGATPLAHNAYKLPLFETLVRRTILQAAA
ncbi:Molybdopterin dehydrogenase, FAD-binding protein [Burkholderiales bacterium]|nr:Molybdopterin dehydrogenase, FAD-binding protein [Burkholderiales bacterium]